MTTETDEHTPRSAVVLLTKALQNVNRIEPETLREPIVGMLAAGIELCAVSRSLLGKPVVNLLALAEALADDGGDR